MGSTASRLEEWNERLNGLRTVVAEDNDNELAGFLFLCDEWVYRPSLCIAPLPTSRGSITLLYCEIESTLLFAGVEVLFTEASVMARPFFHRQGFLIAEEQIVSRRGMTFQAICHAQINQGRRMILGLASSASSLPY